MKKQTQSKQSRPRTKKAPSRRQRIKPLAVEDAWADIAGLAKILYSIERRPEGFRGEAEVLKLFKNVHAVKEAYFQKATAHSHKSATAFIKRQLEKAIGDFWQGKVSRDDAFMRVEPLLTGDFAGLKLEHLLLNPEIVIPEPPKGRHARQGPTDMAVEVIAKLFKKGKNTIYDWIAHSKGGRSRMAMMEVEAGFAIYKDPRAFRLAVAKNFLKLSAEEAEIVAEFVAKLTHSRRGG